MSADDSSWLARFYGRMTWVVIRFPQATVALSLLLTAGALVYTAMGLGYRTSRMDLLNPESDYNRNWIEYIDEFGDEDDAVVVVEGASRDEVVPVLQEVSEVLSHEDRLFHAVLHEVDLSKIRSKGLHYLPSDELLGLERFLVESSPVVEGDWSRMNLGNMLSGMCARLEAAGQAGSRTDLYAAAARVSARGGPTDERRTTPGTQAATGNAVADAALAEGLRAMAGDPMGEQGLERLTEGLLATLGQRRRYQSPWPEMPQAFATLSELSSEYLLTKEGQLGFVLLRLSRGEDSFTHGTEAVDALRELIAHVAARHPGIKIGLTGLPVMENDEMRSSQWSMFWASILSFVGVGVLFVAGFGGVRHALLANLVLLVGMAWAFGFVTYSVGHLNILSVSFTVTLIGIGIDYGVHYVSRYLQHREEKFDCETALIKTSRGISPAITTGAITTAVSFFAAGFTSFTGIAELGIIAGGGILLCALAELIILPAAIYLVDRDDHGRRLPTPLPVHAAIGFLMKAPRLVLVVTLGATVVAVTGFKDLWYDHNLLNMQPVGLESVDLERKLLAESDQSVWYALSIADSRDELLARKEQFLKLETVERVEEIASLLPAQHEIKQPIIERIQNRLAILPERPPLIPVDRPEDLGRVLGRLHTLLAHSGRGNRAAIQVEQIRDALRRLPLADCYELLSNFQQQMAGDLLSRLHALKVMANPEPPKLSDLPPSLVDRFVGQHGRHLLKIYGRGNIWDIQALRGFVHDVRQVDARATGNPLQAYEASLEMKHSYEQAAIYALIVILFVLTIDLRRPRYVLLATFPLGLGVAQMFGLMGLMNIPINPANLIALPLILGIGVDEGVHVVHDYLNQRGRYRMSRSTAVAVTVDSLTTIVGFGALMISSHQGLQSLGRVLVLGVSCCMFTSMIMLPALLTWVTRNRVAPDANDLAASLTSAGLTTRIDAAAPLAGPHVPPVRTFDTGSNSRTASR